MELVRRTMTMRELAREARGKGRKLAFVPTMGALHDGHLSLVRRAREFADLVVVSIFVNPKQFGAGEDFGRYPRDLARDTDLCIQEGVDLVFAPEPTDIYGPRFCTHVEVEGLSDRLEGTTRPGHFRGVTTVVLKLFNIVRPHYAFFGQKDAQQALIVRRMAKDLNIDLELVICPTIRHEDGLALSSRNVYLDEAQRRAATVLFRALEKARMLIEEGSRDPQLVEGAMRSVINAEPLARLDYAVVADPESLETPSQIEQNVLLLVAAWIGETRLIDNALVRLGATGMLTAGAGES
jgi:pantoate--beta-alanine ligase